MKILFTIPPYHRAWQSVPYGVAIVATIAKHSGFDVQVMLAHEDELIYAFNRRVAEEVSRQSINVVAIGAHSSHYSQTAQLIAVAKKAGAITVLGGYLVEASPEIVPMNIGADYCVYGEGEYTFAELMKALQNNEDVGKVHGIAYMKDGKLVTTPPRKCVSDLDELPFVDDVLCHYGYSLERDPTLYLMLSRSCPYQCTFCYHIREAHYRKKSLEYFFNEAEHYISRYGEKIKDMYILDDLFAVDKELLFEFCRRIKKYGIPFMAQTRVDHIDEESLIALKDAGAHCLAYGLESASNKVLASMGKNMTIEKIKEVFALTEKHGIKIQANLIIGDIEDDEETVCESEEFFHMYGYKHDLPIFLIGIYPGTHLYKHALKKGIIKDELAYLKAGCPYINVSKLPDDVFALLPDRYSAFNASRSVIARRPVENGTIELSIGKNGLLTYAGYCPICFSKVVFENVNVFDYRRFTYAPGCKQCFQRLEVGSVRSLSANGIDLHLLRNLAEIYFDDFVGSRIVIWGITDTIRRLLIVSQKLRNMVVKLVDINYNHHNKELYCGLPVESPDALIGFPFDYLITPTIERRGEIISALEKMRVEYEIIEIESFFC